MPRGCAEPLVTEEQMHGSQQPYSDSVISELVNKVADGQNYLEVSTGDNRWDEKAGLQRDAISSQVIDALEAHEIRRPAVKMLTAAHK
jgi:hypothetical protein